MNVGTAFTAMSGVDEPTATVFVAGNGGALYCCAYSVATAGAIVTAPLLKDGVGLRISPAGVSVDTDLECAGKLTYSALYSLVGGGRGAAATGGTVASTEAL